MSDSEKLKHAYKVAGKIVAKFGSAYLPVFERLHNELQIIEAKTDLILLASQMKNK